MSLKKLILKCKNGDIISQSEVYHLFAGKLFAICLKYSKTQQEAEDNLQEAFITIFKKIDQFRFKGSFEGWTLVIESNDFETIDIEQELTFKVHALQESPYLFRFWQGDDDNGDPIYLTIEVPVINLSEEKANEFKETHIKM